MDSIWVFAVLLGVVIVLVAPLKDEYKFPRISLSFVVCAIFTFLIWLAGDLPNGKPCVTLEDGNIYEYHSISGSKESNSVMMLLEEKSLFASVNKVKEKKGRVIKFYKIAKWKLRNTSLVQIRPGDDIPSKFRVIKETIILPENLPDSHKHWDVYVLHPIIIGRY